MGDAGAFRESLGRGFTRAIYRGSYSRISLEKKGEHP